MNDALNEILQDRYSGSITIASKTLDYFEKLIAEAEKNNTALDQLFDQVHKASKILIKAQPNMVVLRWLGNHLQSHFKRLMKSENIPNDYYRFLTERIEQLRKEIQGNLEKIAHMGAKVIATSNKVMTISTSTLVREILLTTHRQKRRFEVYVMKSDPPGEGIQFAEFLAKQGIRTTLIPDAQMGVFMKEMNLVMIGADRIYEQGFINKAGTLPLCLTARHFNIPVYLAAETLKILPEATRAIKFHKESPHEVYPSNNELLQVENCYFERIPLQVAHKIICEDGVFETYEFINWYLKE